VQESEEAREIERDRFAQVHRVAGDDDFFRVVQLQARRRLRVSRLVARVVDLDASAFAQRALHALPEQRRQVFAIGKLALLGGQQLVEHFVGRAAVHAVPGMLEVLVVILREPDGGVHDELARGDQRRRRLLPLQEVGMFFEDQRALFRPMLRRRSAIERRELRVEAFVQRAEEALDGLCLRLVRQRAAHLHAQARHHAVQFRGERDLLGNFFVVFAVVDQDLARDAEARDADAQRRADRFARGIHAPGHAGDLACARVHECGEPEAQRNIGLQSGQIQIVAHEDVVPHVV
jgi:hypothetical protein